MSKSIKKVYGLFLVSFDILLLLYFTIILSMQFAAVQTKLAQLSAKWLSSELSTTVRIDGARIYFFDRIGFTGFYTSDLAGDTLIYTERMDLAIRLKPLIDRQVKISKLRIQNASVQLSRKKGDSTFNFQFIVDYFSSDEKTDEVKINYLISKLSIENGRFRCRDENLEKSGNRFEPSDINITQLNLNAGELNYRKDLLEAGRFRLSFRMPDGFILKEFSGGIAVGPDLIRLRGMSLRTTGSEIHGDFAMRTKSWSDYKSFTEMVVLDARFLPSTLDSRDFAYFIKDLENVNRVPRFSGMISGPVSNIRGKNFRLAVSDQVNLKMNFEIRGLPVFEESFFHLDIQSLTTTKRGIEKIPIPPFEDGKYIKLPENFASLGNVSYKGKISGYVNDFVAYGKLSTDIGNLSTDLALRTGDEFEYSGFVQAVDFHAGTFLGIPEHLGLVVLEANIHGKGLDKKSIEANINGKLDRLDFNDYSYRNVNIAGDFKGQRFQGDITANDRNLKLDFKGKIDLSEHEKQFNFTADISQMRPKSLFHRFGFDSNAVISTSLRIDISATSIDSLIGDLHVDNFRYRDETDDILLSNLRFNSERKGEYKKMYVVSDIADFKIEGRFDMLDGFSTFKKIHQTYLPNTAKDETEIDKEFRFELYLKDYSMIEAIFTPDLSFGPGSYVTGEYKSLDSTLNLSAEIFEFKKASIRIDTCRFAMHSKKDNLIFNTALFNYHIGKSDHRRTIEMDGEIGNNRYSAQIRSGGMGKFSSDVSISGKSIDSNTYEFSLNKSFFTIGDSIWHIDDSNLITLDEGSLEIRGLSAHKGIENIQLGGRISNDIKDQLYFTANHFDLNIVNLFTEESGLMLKGQVDGKASFKDIKGNALFESDLKFNGLEINGRKFGSGHILSEWNDADKRLDVSGNITRHDTSTFIINGFYNTTDEISPIQFDISLAYLPLSALEPFTKDILSSYTGMGSGVFKLRGTLAKPVLTGQVGLILAGAKVDYLNTTYQFRNSKNSNDLIPAIFTPDSIYLPDFTLIDENGNKSRVRLTFIHNHFSKFDMNLQVKAKNFLLLNTTRRNNSLYFGKVYGSGDIGIEMVNKFTTITTNLTTEGGTKFNLPLENTSEVRQSEFIVFRQKENEDQPGGKSEGSEEVLNLALIMNIHASPGAEIKLIFDEAAGDIIRTRGSGDLEINYRDKPGLSIFGEYEIESGDYLFTLEKVVNKRFYIDRGSTIKWNGNPYQGEMNIATAYKLRSRLYDILPEIDETVNYRKKIPIDLKLKISNTIEAPVIGFDIFLPSSKESLRGQLATELSNESCMNQQVFSLLILNAFTPCEAKEENNQANTSAGKSTAYETMSNQLSNWLSRISDKVDVGFTYRPEDQSQTYNSEQVELALSTQLFNDRLSTDFNVGYGNQTGYNQNTKDVVGEFTVEYKIRADGKLRVKAFNHVNQRSYIENDNLYIQGVGLTYQRDYNKLGELFREMFGRKKKEDNQAELGEGKLED